VKTLVDPNTGKTFKLGRTQPIARGPRFQLRNYLKQSLPAPPESVDYSPAAASALSQMYLNDSLSDCVIACMGHIQGVFTGNVGEAAMLPDAEIIRLYSAIGGYIPGEPWTDKGCDEQTALNYWQRNGLGNKKHKITAWMAVDASDQVEVKTALWLFENLMFGMELPDKWINPFPTSSGFWWGKAGPPDPANGHCVAGVGYTPAGVQISTWGLLGWMGYAAIAKYATIPNQGELYTVLSEDAISKATEKAPNGFDLSQLLADLDSMGMGQI
jgi:hypothetical protein